MPPGALGKEVRRYLRTDVQPPFAGNHEATALSADERTVFGRFGRARSLAEDTLQKTLGSRRRAAKAALDSLVERGLLETETKQQGSRVVARRERVLRLILDSTEAADEHLRQLRSNAKADVIAHLLGPDVVVPTVEEVLSATGAKRAALNALEADGTVTLTPAHQWLETALGPEEAALAAAETLARAPAQAALLLHLARIGGPVDVEAALEGASVKASTARALQIRGLAHMASMPSEVILNVRGMRAREAELAARGVAAHAEALGFIAASGGVATAADVLRETAATRRTLEQLEEGGLVVSSDRRAWRDPLSQAGLDAPPPPDLTEDQAAACARVETLLGNASYLATGEAPSMSFPARAPVCLVHGVTGSGKTELYLRAIEHVLFQGRQAIVLVPEIALTAQTIERFAGRFPGRVGIWHSQMSDGERFDTWQRARDGVLDVIVGSRSAIFAPLPRLASSLSMKSTPMRTNRAAHLATMHGTSPSEGQRSAERS